MQEHRQNGTIGRRTFLSNMVMGTGLALGHWGCQPTNQITNLRIGINDWIGYAIALYAQKTGIMEKRGLPPTRAQFVRAQPRENEVSGNKS